MCIAELPDLWYSVTEATNAVCLSFPKKQQSDQGWAPRLDTLSDMEVWS